MLFFQNIAHKHNHFLESGQGHDYYRELKLFPRQTSATNPEIYDDSIILKLDAKEIKYFLFALINTLIVD